MADREDEEYLRLNLHDYRKENGYGNFLGIKQHQNLICVVFVFTCTYNIHTYVWIYENVTERLKSRA